MNVSDQDIESTLAATRENALLANLRALAEGLIALAVLALVLNQLFALVPITDGGMAPSLPGGRSVLSTRLTYQLRPPKRGEIVLLNNPADPERQLARRVVGLPGETLELRGVQVAINGRPLVEPYVTAQLQGVVPISATSRFALPPGEYFVMSDNRAGAPAVLDRAPVRVNQLAGRAWLVVFPTDALSVIDQTGGRAP